jgi:hypothetical protein
MTFFTAVIKRTHQASRTFLCLGLLTMAIEAQVKGDHLGIIFTKGVPTGLDVEKLQFKRWSYAEHLVAKNTAPILKDGELYWRIYGFDVLETGADGSADPDRRKRTIYHKLENRQSFLSKDAKNWSLLKIKLLNTKPKVINPQSKRIMIIEFTSDAFSGAYDVFDENDDHHHK